MNGGRAGHSMYPGKNRWARKVSPERHARNAARLTYHLRLSMQQAVISDRTARSEKFAIEKCNVPLYFLVLLLFTLLDIILYK